MDPPISNCTIEAELAIKPKKDKKNRVPRRVIHFSDGVIEEFSTDSEEEEEEKRKMEEADKGTSKQFLYIYRALIFPKACSASTVYNFNPLLQKRRKML